ncbi:unknown protein [Microcystis aeruginosa NIES-843]|uniref:Uncharacterized protein n=1 Tax=Microcystis aeruginosa (strain NIES-843 / IAM M-2473) TaxID=449447 RepID=B0JRJ4_MICAN|nr:unknown protein [Microcystis aeruginosa NIES-843]
MQECLLPVLISGLCSTDSVLYPTFRTSSYTFIYFYIPQDVLTKKLHCRNYY